MFKSTIRVLSLLLLAGILIAVGGAITAWYKGYDLSNLGNAVFQPDPEENPLRPLNSSNFFAQSKWMGDIEEIVATLGNHRDIDVILDGGPCGIETSTIVDLSDGDPVVMRQGLGVLS